MTPIASTISSERRAKRTALLNYFSLFGSFSTLICWHCHRYWYSWGWVRRSLHYFRQLPGS